MRILHVVTAFPRSPDDVIVPWLVELLKRLQAAGHEVEVFTSSYRGAPDQVVGGIPVHRFRYFPRRWERLTHEEAAPDRMKRSLLYRLMPACFVVAGMIAAWRLCRRQRYDVIHVHWPFPLALFGWAAQRARPAALVTTVYGGELPGGETATPFFRGVLKWAARGSDRGGGISSDPGGGGGAADAFVLPAVVDRRGDTEGLGVVLLEAMNHRVPVIASAIGGITDIVEDGVSGLLVPPGDATALAAALGRLARAPDLAAGLGEAGYRRLRERFSWDAITPRWPEGYAAAARSR